MDVKGFKYKYCYYFGKKYASLMYMTGHIYYYVFTGMITTL